MKTQPVYRKIAEEIRGRIGRGELKPGDRVPSVQELCAEYSVSHITAMRTYRELLSMDCIEGIRGRGYYVKEPEHPSGPEMTGRIAAFIRPQRGYRESDNYFDLINVGIRSECCAHNLDLLCSGATAPLNHYPFAAAGLKKIADSLSAVSPLVDGILIDEHIPDSLLKPILPQITKPVVIVNRETDLPLACLTPPNRTGLTRLLTLAFRLGYERFIYVDAGRASRNISARRAAFLDFMAERNIPEDHIRFIENGRQVPHTELLELMNRSLKGFALPDSRVLFVCCSDYLARPIANAVYENYGSFNRVGVTGFTGFQMASDVPRLATVRVNPEMLGRNAVRLLLDLIGNPDHRKKWVVEAESLEDAGDTL